MSAATSAFGGISRLVMLTLSSSGCDPNRSLAAPDYCNAKLIIACRFAGHEFLF